MATAKAGSGLWEKNAYSSSYPEFFIISRPELLVVALFNLYTFFQNGRHLNILLFLFKLALDASFLSLKFKRVFCLERGIKV